MDRAGRKNVVAGAAVVAACGALALAGWGSRSDDDAPAGLEEYYSQEMAWVQCDKDPGFAFGVEMVDGLVLDGLECAWLTVPLDYDDPSGETIRLAVARSVSEKGEGSVVINPGGPGGSGVDMVSSVVSMADSKLVDALDVVGFDPRGVSRSAPVDCLDDAALDAYLGTDHDLSTEAGLEAARAQIEAFAQGCQERSGSVLAHVDTISAARDMDVLRAALGEPTLTYLGVSYGTKLGATYAQLFPERVGRMVLDSAVDPTATDEEITVIQAGGFESALRAYAEDCLQDADSCPLSGSVDDAMRQIADVIDGARANPMSTPTAVLMGGNDRVLTGSLASTGVISAMYSQEMWPILTQGLQLAIDSQDGTILLLLADVYAQRCDGFTCPVEDGYYANMMEANIAIGCADSRDDMDQQTRVELADAISAAAPVAGRFFAEGLVEGLPLACEGWPTPVVGPLASYTAEGAAPIVVVGVTNDPATPYVWSQAVAHMLDSGVLVTQEGEGHGGYLGGTECLQAAVNDFLVDGKVPENGLVCSVG